MNQREAWYKSWFDTEYYHMLYQYRGDHEAHNFIQRLLDYLQPVKGSQVLDLACGRGRHAKYLSEHDLAVTGVDLSSNNIAYARRYAAENLRFVQGDMRDDLGSDQYSLVFNLFTSFGYFDSRQQSLLAMHNIGRSMQVGGLLVLDFMNVEKVRLGLVREEEFSQACVRFKVRRVIRDGFVVKEISIQDRDEQHQFEERVQLLDRPAFESMFNETGLELVKCFGDFSLSDFEPLKSERLIMIAKRK